MGLLQTIKSKIGKWFITNERTIKPLGKIYYKYRIRRTTRKQCKEGFTCDYPIDIVVTWLDDLDEDWRNQKDYYLNSEDNITKQFNSDVRFRDWNTLHYWFRAIEKYAPWVNKVFLVTCGHLPKWLNMENPKLEVVKHSDFIPKEYLPTFKSRTIYSNLWRIKNLSEHFIYFCDDMFLANEVKPQDFFENGLPRLCAITKPYFLNGDLTTFDYAMCNGIGLINSSFYISEVMHKHPEKWLSTKLKDYYKYNCKTYANGYISGLEFPHLCVPYLKSKMEECYENYEKKMDEMCSIKFRSYRDVNQQIFQLWEMINDSFEPVERNHYGKAFFLKYNDISKIQKNLENNHYKCICLNDDSSIGNDKFEEMKQWMQTILEKNLNKKSSFEK